MFKSYSEFRPRIKPFKKTAFVNLKSKKNTIKKVCEKQNLLFVPNRAAKVNEKPPESVLTACLESAKGFRLEKTWH